MTSAPYDVVLALFMLHELQTAEAIDQALAQARKVVRPDTGVFVAMTMDEHKHMQPLYQMLAEAKQACEKQGMRIALEVPTTAPAIQAFCAGNAEAQLKKRFETVEKYELPSAILIREKQPGTEWTGVQCVVAYLKSLEFVQRAEKQGHFHAGFFEQLEKIIQHRIKTSVNRTLVVRRCDVVYVCQ